MPLLVFARLLFGALSLALLGGGGYLIWSWWDGETALGSDGALHHVREDWRLWVGLALLGWSFLGRLIVLPLVTRRGAGIGPVDEEGEVTPLRAFPSVYVEAFGPLSSPPVVLVHGWGLDRTAWAPIRERLARDHRVYVLDLPGLGRSRKSPLKLIALDPFANVLLALLQQIGRPAVVIGHSIGGMTIQTLARDDAARFDALVAGTVLVNTTYTNPTRTMVFSGLARALRWPVLEPVLWTAIALQPLVWLGAWQSYLSGSAHLANRLGFGGDVTRGQLERTTLLATRNPPGALAKGNLAMFRWDATAAMRNVRKPILIIGGDRDIVTKLEASKVIAQSSSSADLRTVEGANHMGFLEQSAAYADLIQPFTKQALARGG